MTSKTVQVLLSRVDEDFSIDDPVKETEGSAGFDLAASQEAWVYPPEHGSHSSTKVHTGFRVEIPKGHVGLLVERSSLHTRGITLANNIGVIDSDYRGEILIAVKSIFNRVIKIEKGQRLAQLIVIPIPDVRLIPVVDLNETIRGCGGFGSTGS